MDTRAQKLESFESARWAFSRASLSSDVIGSVFQRAPLGDFRATGGHRLDRQDVANATTWQDKLAAPPVISLSPRPVLPSLQGSPFYTTAANDAMLLKSRAELHQSAGFSIFRAVNDNTAISMSGFSEDASDPSARSVATSYSSTPPSKSTPPSVERFKSSVGSATVKPKRKRIRIKTQRRREQCRANQARYRTKQTGYEKDLEAEVIRLRAEIPLLEMQRTRLRSGGQQSVWTVVVEYFHQFRNGIQMPLQNPEKHSGPREWLQDSEAQHQLVFLRSTMASNVALGELCGVDALMEQWRRYSAYFANLHFQLERMEKASEDLMTASASLIVTVTESTLQHVFPYLVETERAGSGEGEEGVSLGAKLLGQRLSIPCTARFEWDDASSRVVRLETTMNFLPPLCQVLGSLKDATFVLEHALITREHAIGKMESSRAYVSELETSVARLLHEIPLLEAQRHRLRFDSQQRAQEVVSEYFQHFRHGIREAGDSQRSASVNQMLQVSGTPQQLMFLRSTMPDVTKALMEEWRRVSAQYKDLHFQLEHMEKTSNCLIAATARLSVTITTTTLEQVFPHLVESEAVEDLTLAVRLLGSRLAYPCLVLFEWDEATNLIVRLETDVDWVTPLLQLLGSLKDVVHVLKSRVPTLDTDGGELEGYGAQTSSLLGSFSS
ncbi:hypothetical protein BBJ28_00003475 [Nothophytophthora sp. Chile5]|nr:hypothetical protein BBJ28_00003475 [Nothophytophthora sp. Chile5]